MKIATPEGLAGLRLSTTGQKDLVRSVMYFMWIAAGSAFSWYDVGYWLLSIQIIISSN